MAHIPDGVLSLPVLAAGAAVAAGALVWSLRSLDEDSIPRVAVVSALFFVASLINVPVGPATVHLLLSGLMGLVLGWGAVPAVFVALVLQSVFFGFGGIATLGVNTVNIALPGILWAWLMSPLFRRAATPARIGLLGAVTGGLSVATTALLVAGALVASDPAYLASAGIVLFAWLPLTAGEALVVGFCCAVLARVGPQALWAYRPRFGDA